MSADTHLRPNDPADEVARLSGQLADVVGALQEAAGVLGAAAVWTTDADRSTRLRAAADRARAAAKKVER